MKLNSDNLLLTAVQENENFVVLLRSIVVLCYCCSQTKQLHLLSMDNKMHSKTFADLCFEASV